MKREALTRFGKYRLGYIWALLEPSLYILVIAIFRSSSGGPVPLGVDPAVFAVSGLLIARTVIIIAGRMMGSITANVSLLTFPMVKTFDVIVGRAVLEVLTLSIVALMFVFGLYVFTGVWAIEDLQATLAGYSATLLLGVSVGAFNAVVSRIARFWERVWSLLSLPLLVGSAVFYLPSSLPPEIYNILWWNPVLHAVEWVRSGIYQFYEPTLSVEYIIWFSLTLLATSMFINKFYQKALITE